MESVLSLQFLCESKTIVKFKAYYITYIKPPTDRDLKTMVNMSHGLKEKVDVMCEHTKNATIN